MLYKYLTKIFYTLKDLYKRSKADDVPALAAQLTYYFILSIFPFLLFLITLLSYTPLKSEIALKSLSSIIPQYALKLVKDSIHQVSSTKREPFLSFGMIAIIWTSSNGMNAVIRAINKAYDEIESRSFWKVRGISILAILSLALTIIFTFMLLVLGEQLGKSLFLYLGISYYFFGIWNLFRYFILILFMMIAFTMIYLLMPNHNLTLKEVLPGSIFTTLGWILISSLFSFYINKFGNYSKIYGSIGGLIVILIWLYWISMIIMIGGELNASLAFSKKEL